MADFPLMPLGGMDTVSEDAALLTGGDSPRHFLRDAVNVNITPAGRAELAPSAAKVTDLPYRDLWQSPLHGDVFAGLNGDWVIVDPSDWSHRVLAQVGAGRLWHEVVNNRVCMCNEAGGLWAYDGRTAERLTIDTPPMPAVSVQEGSMPWGRYGFAISWLRDGVESALSVMAGAGQDMPVAVNERVGGIGFVIELPACLDPGVDTVRLYMTTASGTLLLHEGDYPLSVHRVTVTTAKPLGMEAPFAHRSPMIAGRWLCKWQGRLVVARANLLLCSDALAHHLTDERYNFIQMPERITFVVPVEGGLWVGQVTHVAFLQGRDWDELTLLRRGVSAPVADSAVLLPAELAGQAGMGGLPCALWLSETGHVLGTADGQAVALQPGRLSGITGQGGSVVLDRRVLTAVT